MWNILLDLKESKVVFFQLFWMAFPGWDKWRWYYHLLSCIFQIISSGAYLAYTAQDSHWFLITNAMLFFVLQITFTPTQDGIIFASVFLEGEQNLCLSHHFDLFSVYVFENEGENCRISLSSQGHWELGRALGKLFSGSPQCQLASAITVTPSTRGWGAQTQAKLGRAWLTTQGRLQC